MYRMIQLKSNGKARVQLTVNARKSLMLVNSKALVISRSFWTSFFFQ